jgi:hypothetical protein
VTAVVRPAEVRDGVPDEIPEEIPGDGEHLATALWTMAPALARPVAARGRHVPAAASGQ